MSEDLRPPAGSTNGSVHRLITSSLDAAVVPAQWVNEHWLFFGNAQHYSPAEIAELYWYGEAVPPMVGSRPAGSPC